MYCDDEMLNHVIFRLAMQQEEIRALLELINAQQKRIEVLEQRKRVTFVADPMDTS